MNKIYTEIANLTDKFRTMAYGLSNDVNKINEAVQELMLYLLQANPQVIKKIYESDGIDGLTRYGAVALRRSLTSKRSSFYYKFDKYYSHIDSFTSTVTYDITETGESIPSKHLYNLANEEVDNSQLHTLEIIDLELDS